MRRIVFLVVGLTLLSNVFSQSLNKMSLKKRFNSDIITYRLNGYGEVEMVPLKENYNSPLVQNGLNETPVIKSITTSVNNFRKEFGLTPLTFSQDISNYLTSSNINGLPLSRGFTWGTYGGFSEYGFISHFENKELKFCDYLLDFMSLDDDLFSDLTDSNSKSIGIYFSQNHSDKTYDFMILIK